MNGKRLFLLLAICGLAAGWIRNPAATDSAKRMIGQTARVGIEEVAMEFVARVDTGAATTSVHAEEVRVVDGMVDFVVVNRDGSRVPLRLPLARTGTVRNSGGSKERVFVEMTLNHEGESKRVLVNLNNRSRLTYPLLLGRNWLKGDYIVDVSSKPEMPSRVQEDGSAGLPSLASQ
ncbi:MAG TPA: RimK/LysX family protein [Luteolibacter sp.]|nr:RimK/LysX family protein [Luteolibacter sp.]